MPPRVVNAPPRPSSRKPTPADDTPRLGRKYSIVRRLGDGACGAVWEAEHALIGKRVAVKVLHPSLAEDPDFRARFLAEARAASRINHRNVVDVYDIDETEDRRPFLVMELLEGTTLDSVIERGAVSVEYACEMVVQILAALDAAHRAGIVHRDLKPANVMVRHPRPDRTLVKVLDFGIAQGVFTDGAGPREAGLVFGTIEYMSPEQASAGPVDARSDLYAAGVVLYELLTGKRPIEGDSLETMFGNVITQVPPAPRTLVPGLPERIDALLVSTLAKDPDDRPASAREMLDVLSGYCRSEYTRSIAPRSMSEVPIPLVAAPKPAKKPTLQLVVEPSEPPPPALPKKLGRARVAGRGELAPSPARSDSLGADG